MLFRSANADALDVGCGSGEFTSRLAEYLPKAQVLGVEILPEHVAYARRRYPQLSPRLEFREGDAFALTLPDDRFEFVACRHMLQSVPEPERVIAELIRVTRPGGRLHLLVEDYGTRNIQIRESVAAHVGSTQEGRCCAWSRKRCVVFEYNMKIGLRD